MIAVLILLFLIGAVLFVVLFHDRLGDEPGIEFPLIVYTPIDNCKYALVDESNNNVRIIVDPLRFMFYRFLFVVINSETCYYTTPDGYLKLYKDGEEVKVVPYLATSGLHDSMFFYFGLDKCYQDACIREISSKDKTESLNKYKKMLESKTKYPIEPDWINEQFDGSFIIRVKTDASKFMDYRTVEREFNRVFKDKDHSLNVNLYSSDQIERYFTVQIKCNKQYYTAFDQKSLTRFKLFKVNDMSSYEENIYTVRYLEIVPD